MPKPHLWLIRVIGLIVPQRLRADWRQEWGAKKTSLELLRLCRLMCGSGYALPVAVGFFIGLRPSSLALRKIIEVAPLLDPEAQGHSPKI